MKKLGIINSDSKEFSYGGVAPIMRNMHPYLEKAFEVEYFYLPDKWKKMWGLNRVKIMIYLFLHRNELKSCDFILSHIPEGSYVASFMGVPYAHIYHGNTNPMEGSRYKFGKYFKFVFEHFFKRIEKTCPLKYTVGPVWGDKKKLFNPIIVDAKPLPGDKRSGFMFAGRLELVKNIDHIIKIYSKMPAELRKENHLYIAGFGTQEEKLKQLVNDLGLNDFVHFYGNLPNNEIAKKDTEKKVFLMASTHEGLPTAIAEALSVGVPVVSTDVGDISIVIKNDYNGFLLPLGFKDEDYISCIEKILADYDRFSKAALESSKVFNAENITNSMIKDINDVLYDKLK